MSMLSSMTEKMRETADKVENYWRRNSSWLQRDAPTITRAAVELRNAADTIDYLRNTCNDLQSENAKLRELVADMWRDIPKTESCGWDSSANTCTGSDECRGECALWHRMRDLGVEVDDAPDEPMSDAARRVFDRLMDELGGDGDE